MNKIDMENIGLNQALLREAKDFGDFYIARVAAQYKDSYKVIGEAGAMAAKVSGRFRFALHTVAEYPAVGDFVLLDRSSDAAGTAIIHRVLTRKSALSRKAAGKTQEEQMVAANLDTVFICMSLNQDFNPRRLERYLGIVWDSGAFPVVVLTKSDLCDDPVAKMTELAEITCGVDVISSSALNEDGFTAIGNYLGRGKTVAFVGSSGVGKSTLINRLLGPELLATQEIRSDDKGRHTTTRREMFILPTGGVVIDTPGMREISPDGADLTKTFSDIDALALQCRFHDCSHGKEPGCAVQLAIAEGRLEEGRFVNYLKLQKESRYACLSAKQIEEEKMASMFKEVGGIKNARRLIQEQTKKRRGF